MGRSTAEPYKAQNCTVRHGTTRRELHGMAWLGTDPAGYLYVSLNDSLLGAYIKHQPGPGKLACKGLTSGHNGT